MVEKDRFIGKTIKATRFLREKYLLATCLDFEEGGSLTITMYRKDVPWQIALARNPYEVAMRWTTNSVGYLVVCHPDHDEEQLDNTWRGRRLDSIPEDGGGFHVVVGGETWVPSIHYLTPQGVNDNPTEVIQLHYKD